MITLYLGWISLPIVLPFLQEIPHIGKEWKEKKDNEMLSEMLYSI